MSTPSRSSRGGRSFFRLRLKKSQARILRVLGYPAFAFVIFLLSVYLSLPLDIIKERLERELSQDSGPPAGSGGLGIGLGMDVTIEKLDAHVLPLGATIGEVTLKQRHLPPTAEGEPVKPKSMFVDSVTVHVPFGALFGAQALNLEVQALGGSIEGFGSLSDEGAVVRGEITHLALAKAPLLGQYLPLPLVGTLSGQVDVKVPARKLPPMTSSRRPTSPLPDFSKAVGLVEIKLSQGAIGDGKAKLVVPGDPFLSQGLTFPRLSLGDLTARVVIDRGRATFSEVHARSADAEIWLEGYIELRDPLPQSELRMYLRFQPSAALIKREPTIEIVNNAMSLGRRPDGSLGFAITGSLAAPRSRPSKDAPEGMNARPGILGQVSKDAGPPLRPGSPLPPPSTPSPLAPPSTPPNFVPPAPSSPPPPPPTVSLPPPPPPSPSPPPPSPSSTSNSVSPSQPPPGAPSGGAVSTGQIPPPSSGSHGASQPSAETPATHGSAMGAGFASPVLPPPQPPPPQEAPSGQDKPTEPPPESPQTPPQNLPQNQRGF